MPKKEFIKKMQRNKIFITKNLQKKGLQKKCFKKNYEKKILKENFIKKNLVQSPKQFQAEHFRPKSCSFLFSIKWKHFRT